MPRRILTSVLLGICCLAFAPGASAATLSVNKPCFREFAPVTLAGTGYTPNGQVGLFRDSTSLGFLRAGPGGSFGVTDSSGSVSNSERERRYTLGAIDGTNPAIRAATQLRVSALAVSVRPNGGSPSRSRRVGARGFVGGRTLYAHVRRGRRYKLRVRIGRLRGPCATVSARRRLLRRGTPVGTYRVQFDARRRYSRCRRVTATRTCIVLRVRVFRIFRSSSASASAADTAEAWEQVVGPPDTGGPGFAKLP